MVVAVAVLMASSNLSLSQGCIDVAWEFAAVVVAVAVAVEFRLKANHRCYQK